MDERQPSRSGRRHEPTENGTGAARGDVPYWRRSFAPVDAGPTRTVQALRPRREVRSALSRRGLRGQPAGMSRTQQRPARPETVVELRGGVAGDLADYARRKVAAVLSHTGRPVLYSRVRVTRYGDPARERPVVAQVNIDLDGRPVRVQTEATKPREAVDLLADRLAHRLERVARHWETRRGRTFAGEPHEWRHDFPPARRRSYYPRPAADRRIVRHKTISPLACSVDEAVAEMADLDHDFHLFVEAGRGIDSIVYCAGPTGIRLAQVDGRADEVKPGAVPVTTSTATPQLLNTEEAVDRLRYTGLPFLFYLDGDHGRGCVLYHRYDGHYGLIDPQAESTFLGPF